LLKCTNYKLTLISAPAGYGKTTLLTDYARSSDMALCWYTLDERDRDPAVFCLYLLHSVRQIYPEFGKSFEELLNYNTTELHQEAIIGRLAEEFIANLEELRDSNSGSLEANFRETLLVLDDYQFAESLEVNRFLQRLVWWLPEQFHLIIATRAVPEDLAITKLAAKQMLTIINRTDLAFTTAEVSQLLSQFHQVSEPANLAEALASYSEGWITAVILALSNNNQTLNQIGNSFMLTNIGDTFDATQSLFDYLATEILANQPPLVQEFLLYTSVFELLKPSECDQLLQGLSDNAANSAEIAITIGSAEILRQIEAKNLFITRLTTDGGEFCYQYHTLFRQFLISSLRQKKLLYQQVHLVAARLQQRIGRDTVAIEYFIEADQMQAAAELLSQIIDEAYESGRTDTIAILLDKIPIQTQELQPHILSIKARIALSKGEHNLSIDLYRRAGRLYQEYNQFNHQAKALTNQAQVMLRIGLRKDAADICIQVFSYEQSLMETVEGQQAMALANFVLGEIATEQAENAAAEVYLKRAAALYKMLNDDNRLASVYNVFAKLYTGQGQLIKSNVYLERIRIYSKQTGNQHREAYCALGLAVNNYLQGLYEDVEGIFENVLVIARNIKDNYLELFVFSHLGNLYRDTGRYTEAANAYERALQLANSSSSFVRKMEILLINDLTTNYILQSNLLEAQKLIEKALFLAEDYSLPERVGATCQNQAALNYISESFAEALVAINTAKETFGSHKMQADLARSILLESAILFALGNQPAAMTALSGSLDQAKKLGYEPYLPLEMNMFVHAILNYGSIDAVKDLLTKNRKLLNLHKLIERLAA
jgi:ATP/maltotriose-dependent transcriptional regulator MalT